MSTLNRLKDLTRPTGEEELLDVAYPAPRLHLTLRHAAFAAAAVVVLVAGIVVLQAEGASPAPGPELPAVSEVSEVSAMAAEAGAEDMVVSVVGAVEPLTNCDSPSTRVVCEVEVCADSGVVVLDAT